MATLVLTAAGAAVGGPIGAAIGSAIGQRVDRGLFPANTREGPRLTELALQTSSYGAEIPKLFGTLRVAGTVIWATDLQETRSLSRSGKGQPSVASYSYSASFAVLLSARRITGVGRIWAEGKLLRGAAGDWKSVTGFRLHLGEEDQPVDPLIASAVGQEAAPAHRGCAYAVFENMQLADYGNRIPSLTLEVIADADAVTVGAIAAALAPEVEGQAGTPIGGFAASGGAVRPVLALLADAGSAWFASGGARLVLRDAAADIGVLAAGGESDPGGRAGEGRSVAALETVPRTLAVSHYDPARDYQAGVQRTRRPGAGTREVRVEMPAVLSATEAKGMAEAMLLRQELERTRRTVRAGFAALALAPGACVRIEGEEGVWRVATSRFENGGVAVELVPLFAAADSLGLADSGQLVAAADEVAGTTLLALFETPALDEAVLSAPRLTVAACGTGRGWRGAALFYSLDDGASWQDAGVTGAPAVLGEVTVPPAPGPATLVDAAAAMEVVLRTPGAALVNADDRQLNGGANLALAGDELIQFGRAEPLGEGRWRLSRLLRGRRGTEAASGGQLAGARFVLLDERTARTIDLPATALGTTVRVMASGVGDGDEPVEEAMRLTGASVLPPAPAGLAATVRPDGSVLVSWRRRSRAGWRWLDGVDAPLAEEAEMYRVRVRRSDGSERAIDTATPAIAIEAGERDGGVVEVLVRQRGTIGESPPAGILVPANGRRMG